MAEGSSVPREVFAGRYRASPETETGFCPALFPRDVPWGIARYHISAQIDALTQQDEVSSGYLFCKHAQDIFGVDNRVPRIVSPTRQVLGGSLPGCAPIEASLAWL